MMTPLVIFDLDGTLAESKQPLTSDVALLLAQLLTVTRVGIISGGALPQFLSQVVTQLPSGAHLAHLYILPTSGGALYEWKENEWKKIYEERLSEKEVAAIDAVMREAAHETGLILFSDPSWGPRIESRGSQVSMSALGQQAPLALKKEWDPSRTKREALRAYMVPRLPEFSVGIGGATTIDVTKRGIDKAYGITKLCERINVNVKEALYVGDELEAGGNDEAAYKTDIATKSVRGPSDTVKVIEELLKSA